MRCLSLVLLLTACGPDLVDPKEPPAASVRERLETPAHLQVAAGESAGVITAHRRMSDGWQTGLVDLGIENGELVVSSDARDSVTIEAFQIAFAPVHLPDGTFGDQDAALTNLRIEVAKETRVPATWTGDNQVTLAANLDITLSWTLTLDNGAPTPLGSPDLPPVPVDIVLTGDGEHVDAELRAHAPGELWSWAGLIKLSELQLVAGASLLAD
jgi:hypothetical protein